MISPHKMLEITIRLDDVEWEPYFIYNTWQLLMAAELCYLALQSAAESVSLGFSDVREWFKV